MIERKLKIQFCLLSPFLRPAWVLQNATVRRSATDKIHIAAELIYVSEKK